MKLHYQALFILVFVTAMWGLTFPFIHLALRDISPNLFVLLRMVISSLIFLPFLFYKYRETTWVIVVGGLVIGLFNTATYLFQTEGLQTISASRSAFITGSNVIMVSLLAPLFGLGLPRRIELGAAILCFLGIFVLTGGTLGHWVKGDFWTLGCAITYALTVLSLQVVSKRMKEDTLLTAYFTVAGCVLPLMTIPGIHWSIQWTPSLIASLLFCSVIATLLVNCLMTRYQKHVAVSQAAIIYSLEPVFATLFSVLFFGEHLRSNIVWGGSIILLSVILNNAAREQ